jgi:hypothetical protein
MVSLLFLSCGNALICLSSLVQPIFAQGYSDSSVATTTALSPNPTTGPMDGWGYYACVSDQGGFDGFALVTRISGSVEQCTALCSGYLYDGLSGSCVTYDSARWLYQTDKI